MTTDNLQLMLCHYAQRVLDPMRAHFNVLSTHLGRDLARQLAVAFVGANLKLEAAEFGHPVSAEQMPDTKVMQQAVNATLWPALQLVTEANASQFQQIPKRRGRPRKVVAIGNVVPIAGRMMKRKPARRDDDDAATQAFYDSLNALPVGALTTPPAK